MSVSEAQPSSLDGEALKPLYFQVPGDDEWSCMAESEVLAAFAASQIPAATRFKRGEEGLPRTLATLLSWNGVQCPFADFSFPERREGLRETRRSSGGDGDGQGPSTDVNENVVGGSEDSSPSSSSSSS
ncbi:hypothetical protein PFISCL1PPCAC_6707, partial [Pristionchus fissidentatus]